MIDVEVGAGRARSTLIRFAPRSILAASRTLFSSALSGAMRSSASGCSLEITRMRAPALRIAGVSGACIRPSMVQSTTKPAWPSAVTTGASRRSPRLRRSSAPAPDGVARRRHHHVERPCAEAQQRQFGQMHVERARLRFGQDRGRVAALDSAAFEHLAERVDPFAFDAIGEHGTCQPATSTVVPAQALGHAHIRRHRITLERGFGGSLRRWLCDSVVDTSNDSGFHHVVHTMVFGTVRGSAPR